MAQAKLLCEKQSGATGCEVLDPCDGTAIVNFVTMPVAKGNPLVSYPGVPANSWAAGICTPS